MFIKSSYNTLCFNNALSSQASTLLRKPVVVAFPCTVKAINDAMLFNLHTSNHKQSFRIDSAKRKYRDQR